MVKAQLTMTPGLHCNHSCLFKNYQRRNPRVQDLVDPQTEPLPVQSMSIAVFGFVSPTFGLYSVNVEMFWGLVLLQMTVDLPHNARFITFGHVVTCFLLQYYIVARYVLYIFNNNFI